MDADRLRTYLLTLPHVTETMQWGANLVFWVGDKTLGGKMFAIINLDDQGPQRRRLVHHALMMYSAGLNRYSELLELEGLISAPYLARAYWVAALNWEVFTPADWRRELHAAHAITLAKLPKKLLAALTLPAATQPRPVAPAAPKQRSNNGPSTVK